MKKFDSIKIKECPICGNPFEVSRYSTQEYCSDICRIKGKKIRCNYKNGKLKVEKRICVFCGKEFIWTSRFPNKKYCSDECCKKAQKLKQESSVSWKTIRWEIFKADNFQCQYCDRTPDKDKVKLVLDDIFLIEAGGKVELSNLITACEECNISKSCQVLPANLTFRFWNRARKRKIKKLRNENLYAKWQKIFDDLNKKRRK